MLDYVRTENEGAHVSKLSDEISSRRTFAIISHPDAGKTTLTEKLLLYTGSIQTAGAVKGKGAAKHAVSDWMDIEAERGISVTSSVLQFTYQGKCVNILDTPGHQDFSEDTYRTLMAADSVVMVIDGAKGVEAQTIKLFKVCTLRHIPIFTFVNKLDRETRDPFDLMEEIEDVLGISTYPVNWPIGCGRNFRGVFDRESRRVIAFQGDGHANATKKVTEIEAELGSPELDELIGADNHATLVEDIELLDGADSAFDLDAVLAGKLTPVFFGSALTNFGVEPFLRGFLRMAPGPKPYTDVLTESPVDPVGCDFSGFVFKIQANMDKRHRDRIAFLRICSGKFERGMAATHVQSGKKLKLAVGTSMMAEDRAIVDEAYAGDIVGLFDPGIFSIGDTICAGKDPVQYPPMPTFAPEHFARITQINTLKRKQFMKGCEELSQEGAIQLFRQVGTSTESMIVGVVGVLQLDVLERRLQTEYGVEVRRQGLGYTQIRWILNDRSTYRLGDLKLTSSTCRVEDMRGNRLLLFNSPWDVNFAVEHNPTIEFSEFGNISF
jgi:peptide chain release factor 3